ncbi:hypothetical protein LTR95_005628 [Oleoguttula sp. CCFEE 5521]
MISRAAKYLSIYGDPIKRPDGPPLPRAIPPTHDVNGDVSDHGATLTFIKVAAIGGSAVPHHRLMTRLLHVTPKQALCATPATAECSDRSVLGRGRITLSNRHEPHSSDHVGAIGSAIGHDAEDDTMTKPSLYDLHMDLNQRIALYDGSPCIPQLTLDTADLCACEVSLVPSPVSPHSLDVTYSDVGDQGYETPFTSPESSPLKRQADRRSLRWQMDGAGSSHEEIATSRSVDEFISGSASVDDVGETLDLTAGTTTSASPIVTDVEADLDTDDEDRINLIDLFPTPSVNDKARYGITLLQPRPRTPTRRPSALLSQCIRNPSPRQQSLRRKGIASPDRLIPSREITPTKEALVTSIQPGIVPSNRDTHDPFGPSTRRSIRMAEQYATLRGPAIPLRPAGVASLRVPYAPDATSRAASSGNIWSVGGVAVTEGVLSTTDGRGGRVTSGTSAPHYSADFLRKRLATDDEATHARRLAMAMDLRCENTMISPRSDASRASRSSSNAQNQAIEHVTWRDGRWQSPVPGTKPAPTRVRRIPTIPYRVLDAPSLRDDFYCSLLAFSPTLSCLAVGLGPHVYLWSEPRGTTPTNMYTASQGASHVTSLSFSSSQGGKAVLAIGRADGKITLWSPVDPAVKLQTHQPAPVSCVSFRPTTSRRRSLRDSCTFVDTEELLAGDEVGNVYLYAVEWPTQEQRDIFDWHGSITLLAKITCHNQQICGMAKVLKTPPSVLGPVRPARAAHPEFISTDTIIQILPGEQARSFALNAACKAIAFAPWNPTLLAAGGGSNDRCIHLFSTATGAKLATLDCYAQVTSIVFNANRKEFAATFGFAQPDHAIRVAVFGWPDCECKVKVPWWGEERALYAVEWAGADRGAGTKHCKVGDGGLVVATSDASIKFHELWSKGVGAQVRKGLRAGGGVLDKDLGGGLTGSLR